MRIQLDWNVTTPAWIKKASVVLAPLGLVLATTMVQADVPNSYTAGETLTAASLNENFAALDVRATALEAATADLDARVGTVEAVPQSLTVVGTAEEVGAAWSATVYSHADLVLPPGTWVVQGYASLTLSVNADAVALGLFDVTANADVPSSVGAIENLFTDPALGFRGMATAQTLITVTTPTTLRLKATPNGNSVVTFFDFDQPYIAPTAALGPHKLTAIRLR